MSVGSEAVKRMQRAKQALLREFKAERGCCMCGEKHPACLDFHHVDGNEKHRKLSRRYMHGGLRRGGPRWGDMSYDEILREVAQCAIVCSNCHRKMNALLHGWQELPTSHHSRRRDFLAELRQTPLVTLDDYEGS